MDISKWRDSVLWLVQEHILYSEFVIKTSNGMQTLFKISDFFHIFITQYFINIDVEAEMLSVALAVLLKIDYSKVEIYHKWKGDCNRNYRNA